jgi:hypothetical protein
MGAQIPTGAYNGGNDMNELLHRRLHVDLRRTASSGCQRAC